MGNLSDLRNQLGLNGPTNGPKMQMPSGNNSALNKQLDDRRKKQEEEIKQEMARRREEQRREAQFEAIQNYDKPSNASLRGQSSSTSNRDNNIPMGRGSNRDTTNKVRNSEVINQGKQKFLMPYKEYGQTLNNDLSELRNYSRETGVRDEDVKKSIIPKEDLQIQKRLEKIASKLKPGKEGLMQNAKEGWHEKEIQNMISQETVRKMNGLSNNLDTIENWMKEHPEIGYSGERDGVMEWVDKGTRFALGALPKQMADSYNHALKEPATYAWIAALTAASVLAAPATAGASLATTPLLISQLPLLTRTVASIKPAAAVALGMRAGSYDNMAKLEMASSYNSLIEVGVDKRWAVPISSTVGAFNGILENMQMDGALSMIPGFDNLIENGSKLAKKELTKQITKVAANYGIEVLTESLEEAMQGGISDLGLSLGEYLKDAPDPSTLGGLKTLGSRMASKDFCEVVSLEGYEAMKSMWLSPLLSSGGRTATQAGMQQLNQNKQQKDLVFGAEGTIDQAVKAVVKDNNNDAMDMLLVNKHMIEDMSKQDDLSNQDKATLGDAAQKINTTLSDVLYKAKEKEPTLNYKPSNQADMSDMFLKELHP